MLIGGDGSDCLVGGDADRFYRAILADTTCGDEGGRVVDFSRAERNGLDLSVLADGSFAWFRAGAFSLDGTQRVNIALDGGPRDMEILVYGETRLTVDDFIL